MVIAIGVLLALVCVGVAAVPFLKYRKSRQTVDPTEVIVQLEGQRQLIYREMLALEESSRAGSVPEPEFNAVGQTLRRRAAENLWLQHRWEERLAGLDEALEAIIAQAGISAQVRSGDSGQSFKPCTECGARAPVNTTASSHCGTEKENAQSVKPVSEGGVSC